MTTDNVIHWNSIGYNASIRELKSRSLYSPDFRELFKYEYHLVFVDGIFKKKFDNHSLFLRNSKYLGEARSCSENFILKKGQGFAIALKKQNINSLKNVLRYVWGELYAVPPTDLLLLDTIHANGTLYNRQKEPILCMEQFHNYKNSQVRPTVDAFWYIGNEAAWENVETRFASLRFDRGVGGWDYLDQTFIT